MTTDTIKLTPQELKIEHDLKKHTRDFFIIVIRAATIKFGTMNPENNAFTVNGTRGVPNIQALLEDPQVKDSINDALGCITDIVFRFAELKNNPDKLGKY